MGLIKLNNILKQYRIYIENQMESKEFEQSRVLYLSNFPKNTQKQHLEELLNRYGTLTSLNVIHKQDFAFAFAQFEYYRDAACAVKQLSQKFFQGMNLKVQFKNKKHKENQGNIDKKSLQLKKSHSDINDYDSSQSTLPVNSNQNIFKNSKYQISQNQLTQRTSNAKQIQRYQKSRNNKRGDSPSLSPSRSRSRSKTKKNYNNLHLSNNINENKYRQYKRSISRSPAKTFHRSSYKHNIQKIQDEMDDIFGMIKHLQKNLHRLHKKLQDFRYDYEEDTKQGYRRRN